MNIQVLFPLGWTGLISLQSKGLLKVFSNIIVKKMMFSSLPCRLQLWPTVWSGWVTGMWAEIECATSQRYPYSLPASSLFHGLEYGGDGEPSLTICSRRSCLWMEQQRMKMSWLHTQLSCAPVLLVWTISWQRNKSLSHLSHCIWGDVITGIQCEIVQSS